MSYNLNVNNTSHQINFNANPAKNLNSLPENLTKNLTKKQNVLAKVINMKEGDSGLSHSRFAQATLTNWFPKAVFARSLADLSEITFLEAGEGALFFYLFPILGENIARKKIFSKFLPKELHKSISSPVSEIVKDSKSAKKLLPVKAAIVLSCATIPAAEYALSFAKNLFTLKVFKKADFSSIVNLDKNKKEDTEAQQRVEKSAKSHLKKAGIFSLIAFAASLLLGTAGQKSKTLQKASEILLNPGDKIYKGLEKAGVKNKTAEKFFNKYLSLDFARKSDGSLALGNGQLALTVLAGVAGYFGAAKDRGKLDVQEVATRVPVIALYTIFGSTLFDEGFKKLLFKKNKYSEILTQDKNTKELKTASLNEIYDIAKKSVNGDEKLVGAKVKELFKGKAVISMVPFMFSLLVVGGLLALISRLWTQYRYNHGVGNSNFKADYQEQNLNKINVQKFKNMASFCGEGK